MNPSSLSSSSRNSALFLCSALLSSSLSYGNATFDFNDGTAFDNVGIGATMSVLDAAESINVTLTSVDIIGQDASLASDGIQTHSTNIPANTNAIGIRDASNPNGASNNSRDFDPGEGWVISFDVAVKLISIDFAGQSPGENFIISSSSFDSFLLEDGQEDDIHDLLQTEVPAGTQITIQMDVPHAEGLGARISEITVAAVPDPNTGTNLIWAGADGDAWNTSAPNFTGDDTEFNTGANVDIQTPGAINIDAGGITAGVVSVTSETGTITLQNGNLTASSLLKSGESILNIASPITLDTGVTTLAGGTLQVGTGATLISSLASFSEGSTLQVDSGATITVANGGALGTGGATINMAEPLSLGNVPSSILDVPLIKTGPAALTFTGDLGTRTTGTVALDILAGSVIATEGTQFNLSGTTTFDGDLVLEGGRLELHGNTISGTGSIIAQSGNATLDARFQGGMVNIANPILLTSDLFVDAPTNGNSNSELHLNGIISGTGNLLKIGNGLVASTGENTYTGNTSIAAGILSLATASLADTSTVDISDTGVLALTHASGDTVTSLTIDGIELSPGTYGSSSVTDITPQNIDDTHFSGDGWLIVTSGPLTDYGLWASAEGFNLIGDMTDDDDNDGLSNHEEYIFGLNPTDASSVNPYLTKLDKVFGDLTFTRRNTSLYSTGLTYTYEYSTTLADDFTPFIPDEIDSDAGDPVEEITITVPAELLINETLFVRVFVR
ncbi:MAG: hypothetical protein ACSHYF_15680 [Verrucomicrobiaceae bacterium]